MIGIYQTPQRVTGNKFLNEPDKVNNKAVNSNTFQRSVAFQGKSILEDTFEKTPELEQVFKKVEQETSRALIEPLCVRPKAQKGFNPDPELFNIFNKIVNGNHSALEKFESYKISKSDKAFMKENLIISLQESLVSEPTPGKAVALVKLKVPERLAKVRSSSYKNTDNGTFTAANKLILLIIAELEKIPASSPDSKCLEDAKDQLALYELNLPVFKEVKSLPAKVKQFFSTRK